MVPSSVTAVPGSQGPSSSGSVIVDVLQVPTQASAREMTSKDELDVEQELGDSSELWTPLTANPVGVSDSRGKLLFSVPVGLGSCTFERCYLRLQRY